MIFLENLRIYATPLTRTDNIFIGLFVPNFDRLDEENAQFWPEHQIPHAKIFIMTAGNV